MFIGHDAIGLASKRLAPRTSLGWLIAAPLLLDLIWPIFLLLGIERVEIRRGITRLSPLNFTHYPWSHSLAMCVVWAIVFAGVYAAITRYMRGAVVLFAGVMSHWVLDWVTHRPDLPLYPGGPKVGLGLWNYPIPALGIEAAMFAIALLIYRDITAASDRIGSLVMWAFIAFLGILFIVNAGGIPPPNVKILAYSALALWLLPFWAAWFDAHRVPEE
jgi:membrane-bound metal-dependent hydrolase YbcI (DUF457 family)